MPSVLWKRQHSICDSLPRERAILSYSKKATVVPQKKRTFRIEGLAKTPADVELKGAKDTHVLDAIEMAGATPAQLADLVFVIRELPKMDEPIIISISLARVKRDDNENLRLAEGDIVIVRRTMSNMVGDAFSGTFHASKAP
jgi:protein involved in polysaccharide export with SLBB domain